MLRKSTSAWLLCLATCVSIPAHAQTVVLCTETDAGVTAGDAAEGRTMGGCVATIPTSAPPLLVASDGEVPFDPFGAGFSVSDAIVLNASWLPDPRFPEAFAPGFWT